MKDSRRINVRDEEPNEFGTHAMLQLKPNVGHPVVDESFEERNIEMVILCQLVTRVSGS